MAKEYRVTFMLSDTMLAHFLTDVGPHVGKMVITYVEPEEEMVDTPAPADMSPTPVATKPKATQKAPIFRTPRRSKVGETILKALESGPASNKELKEALLRVGLAGSSATSGLIMLMQAKKIQRLPDGHYALADWRSQEELPLESAPEAAE